VKQIINRDYNVFSGRALENFFKQLFADSHRYNRIGSYWERGNHNEIDLVGVNDVEKKIVIAEIKLNKAKIRLEGLKRKSHGLLASFPGYTPQWLALSLEDTRDYMPLEK
jgi:uncharacterized protein